MKSTILALAAWALISMSPSVLGNGAHVLFDSGDLAQGESWSHVFDAEGEYAYHCHPHPSMTAMVRVREDAEMSGTANVSIVDFAYAPSVLTVRPGTNVTWTNQDPVVHTVTAKSGHGHPTTEGHSPGVGGAAVLSLVLVLAWGRFRPRQAQ